MQVDLEFEDLNAEYYGEVLSAMLGRTANYLGDWSATGPLIERFAIDLMSPDEAGGSWMATVKMDGRHDMEDAEGAIEAIVKAIIRSEIENEGLVKIGAPADVVCEWLSNTAPAFEAVTNPSDIHDVNLFLSAGMGWIATPKSPSLKGLSDFSSVVRVVHQLDGRHTSNAGMIARGIAIDPGMTLRIKSVETKVVGDKEYATAVVFGFGDDYGGGISRRE